MRTDIKGIMSISTLLSATLSFRTEAILEIELRTAFFQLTYIFLVPGCYLKHEIADKEDILYREPRRL